MTLVEALLCHYYHVTVITSPLSHKYLTLHSDHSYVSHPQSLPPPTSPLYLQYASLRHLRHTDRRPLLQVTPQLEDVFISGTRNVRPLPIILLDLERKTESEDVLVTGVRRYPWRQTLRKLPERRRETVQDLTDLRQTKYTLFKKYDIFLESSAFVNYSSPLRQANFPDDMGK